MAPDEMDQDHGQKSGREELDQIRAKEQEIRELREEIRAKEQEIRELREEIRTKEQEIREVENELATAPGTELRKLLEAKLQFLREDIRSRDQQISSRDQQISSRDQQISSRYQQISSLRQEISSVRSVQEAAASAGGANRISLSERTKCDFDFKVMEDWKPGISLDTAEIAVALEEFGGFPRRYYVRLEETMVFTNCLNSFDERNRLRAVILGSPGVGKSVFLVLLAFYLAHVHSRSVLILRKLKEGQPPLACVHVCREGYSGSRFQGLAGTPGIFDQLGKPLYFLDGFTQQDINQDYGYLGGFSLLATSSQYQLKSDDGHTRCILLPAWRPEDLRGYAGLMGTFPSDFEENFENAYSYSGGSLGEFLKSDLERNNVFSRAMRSIKLEGVRNLLAKYGALSTSQLDTIGKLFVKNRLDPKHYVTIAEWVRTVDSSVAVRELYDMLSEEDFLTILTVAEGIGGAFYGHAFEWYIHKRASSGGGLSFEAWQYDSKSRIGEFDVPGGAAVWKGERLTDCHDFFKLWRTEDTKYWFPNTLNFFNIDFIAKCNRLTDGDKDNLQKYLVYIQITTAGSHALDTGKLNTLDDIFKGEYANRVYIALLPEKASIKDFTLKGELRKSQIPLFISTICSGGRKMKRTLQ